MRVFMPLMYGRHLISILLVHCTILKKKSFEISSSKYTGVNLSIHNCYLFRSLRDILFSEIIISLSQFMQEVMDNIAHIFQTNMVNSLSALYI